MAVRGLWEQLTKKSFIRYSRPYGIDRILIYLSSAYIFSIKMYGCYFVPETEEDLFEDINHGKFLLKYRL